MSQVLFSFMAFAAEKPKVAKPKEEQKEAPSKVVETTNEVAEKIEQVVEQTAEDLDLALAGKKYTKEPNETTITVNQFVSWSEGGVLENSTDFGVNLRLPNFERRWAVRFSSFDEGEESRDVRQRRVRTRPRQREFGAAFLFLKQLGKVRTTFQPRLVLKSPVEMSYILSFSSEADQKRVRMVPKIEFFADAEKGTGEFASLEFSYDLTRKLELILSNEEEYREQGNFFTTNHALTINQFLAYNKTLGFTVQGVSVNRPVYRLDVLTLSPAYAHVIQPDRLRYIVTPFLRFEKERRFKGESGLSLNLEVIF